MPDEGNSVGVFDDCIFDSEKAAVGQNHGVTHRSHVHKDDLEHPGAA